MEELTEQKELSLYANYAINEAKFYQRENEEGMTLTERKALENDGTMVTVVCITYKHEEFIAQALDSFLMQKTNFKFKIFVGEDCGPDGTADIIRDYAARYPDQIVPFLRKENMGAQRNLIDLCQRATSPYIAFCEGDDYWVDEYKLQKQFDFMEEHPESRACIMKTEVQAPDDWHLRSWYRETADKKILYPDSIPGYQEIDSFSPVYFINRNVAHTSTYFFRWNYDLPIPEWYYEGNLGDAPLLLMQMGNSKLGYIKEIGSVYRINEGSIYFNKNRDEHFLNTRQDMVRYLTGMRDFAIKHWKGYPIVALENRIKLEAANYLRTAVKLDDEGLITSFFIQYPEAGKISLNAYLSFYNDSRAMTSSWSWEGYKLIARDRYFRNLLRPVAHQFLHIKRGVNRLKRCRSLLKGKLKNIVSLVRYWQNTAVPKEQSLWVFSSFNKRGYVDNTKYFYEYVLQHHPEIHPVWLTLDKAVYEQLAAEQKPVAMMRTAEGRRALSRATIAVTDHFRMSDYEAFSGLNDQTHIVQLWHGVGLKAIGDLKNTNVPGVTFSADILATENDNGITKWIKKLKYVRHAYYRELFEHYFLLVCPGQERVEQIAKPLHIPIDRCFFSGHPRNILLHQTKPDTNPRRVLYAPTYRWNAAKEKEMVQQIVDSAPNIQQVMEQNNAVLTVRLHPHTWRNYTRILDNTARKHNRIVIDQEKDVYQTLGTYSVVISDYSSIAYDFIMVDRPVVFFAYDREEFIARECQLNYDYDTYSPGTQTVSWAETLDAVQEYLNDPEKDGPWRRKVRDEFFDMSVNDENNSERIVQEIKRRLAAEDHRPERT